MKILALQDFAATQNQTFDRCMATDGTIPSTLVQGQPLSPAVGQG